MSLKHIFDGLESLSSDCHGISVKITGAFRKFWFSVLIIFIFSQLNNFLFEGFVEVLFSEKF
jgi:hypothetical protein